MDRLILLLVAVLSTVIAVHAQRQKVFFGVGTLQGFSAMSGGQTTGTFSGFTDSNSEGYNATQVQVGYRILDAAGREYKIDAIVGSPLFSTVTVTVSPLDNAFLVPQGKGVIYDPSDYDLIPNPPSNAAGVTQLIRSRIDVHNIKVLTDMLMNIEGNLVNTDSQNLFVQTLNGLGEEVLIDNNGYALGVGDTVLAYDSGAKRYIQISIENGNTITFEDVTGTGDGGSGPAYTWNISADGGASTEVSTGNTVDFSAAGTGLSVSRNGADIIYTITPQIVSLISNTLALSGGGGSVDLSVYLDNTDNQTVDQFELSASTLSLSIENDGEPANTVDLSQYAQDLDATADSVVITGGANVARNDVNWWTKSASNLYYDTGNINIGTSNDIGQLLHIYNNSGNAAAVLNNDQTPGVGQQTSVEHRINGQKVAGMEAYGNSFAGANSGFVNGGFFATIKEDSAATGAVRFKGYLAPARTVFPIYTALGDRDTTRFGIGIEEPLFGLHVNTTDAIKLPSGDVAGRKDTTTAAQFRYLTTLNRLEVCNGSDWKQVAWTDDIDTLDIMSLTETTQLSRTKDYAIVYDESAGENRRVSIGNLTSVVKSIATADFANDYVLSADTLSKYTEIIITAHLEAAATSDLQVTVPAPTVQYIGKKIVLQAMDEDSGGDNVVFVTNTDSLWAGGGYLTSTPLGPSARFTVTCTEDPSNPGTYIWWGE